MILALLAQRKKRRFAQRALEERYRFEALISELSASLIHLPADQVGEHIHQGLRRVCELLNTGLAVLSRYSPQTRTFQAEESYLAEGLKDALPADELVLPSSQPQEAVTRDSRPFRSSRVLPFESNLMRDTPTGKNDSYPISRHIVGLNRRDWIRPKGSLFQP